MSEWPDERSLTWLIIGLAPLSFLCYRVIARGRESLFDLLTLGVALIWLTYHATPWLAIPHGGWTDSLTQPLYVSEAIRFATLAMIAYCLGYVVSESSIRRSGQYGRREVGHHYVSVLPKDIAYGGYKGRALKEGERELLPRVSMQMLVFGAVVVFMVHLILIGGIDELLRSSRPRGEGQFDVRIFFDEKLKQVGNVAIGVAAPIVGVLAVLKLLDYVATKKYARVALACVVVISCSIPFVWKFSRGAGFLFVFGGLCAFAFSRRFPFLIGSVMLFVGLVFSRTGFVMRGEFYPGVLNFVEAILSSWQASGGVREIESVFDPTLNPFNAVDPWTAAVGYSSSLMSATLFERLGLFFEVLQPLPSEFVTGKWIIGEDLAWAFGTWGSTGITTPAFAELYLLFGDGGAVAVAMLGVIAARVNAAFWNKRDLPMGLLYVSIIYAFVAASHGGVRSATRPILYATVVMVVWVVLKRFSVLERLGKRKVGVGGRRQNWQRGR